MSRNYYRFSGAVVVVRATDGDATGFEMSTARMTFDRMLSVVTLDVLAVPAVVHVNDVSLRHHFTAQLTLQQRTAQRSGCTFFAGKK